MNSKEIKEALEIIKKPIKVNCIEYKCFNEENYNKLLKVYENCLWFANNFEQINLAVENLQKENEQLKENNLAMQEEMARTWAKLQQKEDIINKAKEELYIWGEALFPEFQKKMLKILNNKGE